MSKYLNIQSIRLLTANLVTHGVFSPRYGHTTVTGAVHCLANSRAARSSVARVPLAPIVASSDSASPGSNRSRTSAVSVSDEGDRTDRLSPRASTAVSRYSWPYSSPRSGSSRTVGTTSGDDKTAVNTETLSVLAKVLTTVVSRTTGRGYPADIYSSRSRATSISDRRSSSVRGP